MIKKYDLLFAATQKGERIEDAGDKIFSEWGLPGRKQV